VNIFQALSLHALVAAETCFASGSQRCAMFEGVSLWLWQIENLLSKQNYIFRLGEAIHRV
jgi:hypothetical protein